MSTTVTTPAATPEAPVFDAKAHIEARMQGKPAPPPKAAEAPPAAEVKPVLEVKPDHKADTSRSERRRTRAAEERTAALVLDVLAKSGVLPKKPEEIVAPAEPKRADFAAGDEGTAAFLRATQKFDREQEVRTAESKQTEAEANRERFQELDAKAAEDIKVHFPDWDARAKEWAENEDLKTIKYDDIPVIMGLLSASDLRAAVQYHWMKNPEEFLELVEMAAEKQIRYFHRLEGRLEKEYDSRQAAQASEPDKGKKDREHLAEAEPAKAKPGETAAGGQPAKPRPSSEVAARGGSTPEAEPEVGSAAWMALRNERLYGNRRA